MESQISEDSRNPARLLALYLPQFHPIPENDTWWGKGFTEWTNTGKAKPLFRGHYQPHVPADLGYYDLRVSETRIEQAELARKYGIEGFCYYHYWFGSGRRLLERPFEEVLASGQPDFPFCLFWANESWTGIWHGAPRKTLIQQEYPGPADDEAHFRCLLPAFKDPRYLTVDGRPIFIVWRPSDFPDPAATVQRWQGLAKSNGLPGLYLIGTYRLGAVAPESFGFDASIHNRIPPLRAQNPSRNPLRWIHDKWLDWRGIPTIWCAAEALDFIVPATLESTRLPSVIHAWDNTPRSGARGLVIPDASPDSFRQILRRALKLTANRPRGHRLIFLKSWNEWAEGNHLEPDLKFGHRFLEVIRSELQADQS